MGRVNNAACNKLTFFYEHHGQGEVQFLLVTAPKEKFGQCSCMGKFCPPLTSSPNLPRGKNYMVYYCAIGMVLGGESYYNIGIWEIGCSLLVASGRLGKLLKVRGRKVQRIIFEGDSKTINPVVGEKRVNPT
jgi:hypothetical protein